MAFYHHEIMRFLRFHHHQNVGWLNALHLQLTDHKHRIDQRYNAYDQRKLRTDQAFYSR